MKRRILWLCTLLVLVLCLISCSEQGVQLDKPSSAPSESRIPQESPSEVSTEMPTEESITSDTDAAEQNLILTIDGTVAEVQWEENDTVSELLAYAQNAPIVVNTSAYGGFEQVGGLPQSFSRNDVQMTTQPGDIVLYSGNQLVAFFGSNSWSYTKLGHIEGLSADDLTALLSKDSTVIELQLKSR